MHKELSLARLPTQISTKSSKQCQEVTGDSSMEAMQGAKQSNGLSLVGSRGARKAPSFVVSGHPVQHTAHN